jgi:hypothetical protein
VRLEKVEPKLDGMAEWTLDQARRAARVPRTDAPFAGVPFLLVASGEEERQKTAELKASMKWTEGDNLTVIRLVGVEVPEVMQ